MIILYLLYQTFTCKWSPHSPLSPTGMGSLFPSPGHLPNPGTETRSPALRADSLLSEPPGKPLRAAVSYKPRSTGSSVQTGFVGFDGQGPISPSNRSGGGADRSAQPQVQEWNWSSAHSLLNYSFWKGFCFIIVIFVIPFISSLKYFTKSLSQERTVTGIRRTWGTKNSLKVKVSLLKGTWAWNIHYTNG